LPSENILADYAPEDRERRVAPVKWELREPRLRRREKGERRDCHRPFQYLGFINQGFFAESFEYPLSET
jgi:hypothetical protein